MRRRFFSSIKGTLEPSNHATLFTVTTISDTEIRVAWVDAVGDILPDGYLIVARTAAGSFPAVNDASPVSDDIDLSNGSGAKNITHSGGSQSYVFSSLTANTQYFFEIYAYKGALSSINYKKTAPVPSGDSTTWNNQSTLANKLFEFDGTAYNASGGEVDQWTDLSGGGNHALDVASRNTPNSALAYINGVDSILFTATNNEILRVPAITGITNFSIYALFEPGSTSGTRRLIGNQSGQTGFIILIDANRIQITMRDGTTSQIQQILNFTTVNYPGPVLLIARAQSNGAGTSVMNVSLNGIEMINKTNLNSMVASTADIDIGSDAANLSYQGYIHMIKMYSVFHTQEEVNQNINSINSQFATSYINAIFVQRALLNSSIDAAVTNLYGRLFAEKGFVSMPIVVLNHSWNGNADDFTVATIQRFGDRGLFVAAFGERGRNGAGGSADVMREDYDVYELIKYVVQNYSNVVDTSRVITNGYSGGGGQVARLRTRFPYMFVMSVQHFAMTDYADWHSEEAAYQATLEARIGGTPAAVPINYDARKTVDSEQNAPCKLWAFHDVDDDSVAVHHTQDMQSELDSASFTNYDITITDSLDNPRAIHGLPNTGDPGEPNIQFEDTWVSDCFTLPAPVIPSSGTHKVRGFLIIATPTDFRFEFWIGLAVNPKSSGSQNNAYGVLQWNYDTNSYTFTPGHNDTIYYYLQDDQGRIASGSTTGGSPANFSPA